MFKKLIFLLLGISVSFLIGLTGLTEAGAKEPKLKADAVLLYDLKEHQVIWGKNIDKSVHPASLTKVLTVLMAFDRGKLNEIVTIGPDAHGTYIGSTLGLQKGDKIKIAELINAAMIVSANDAAVAIGEHMAGDEETFTNLMTLKALLLGAEHSRFVNANGYSVPNHKTTPRDLATITDIAMSNKQFSDIAGKKTASIKFVRGEKERTADLINTNKLLFSSPLYNGIKTGTTAKAGGCLLVSKQVDGRPMLAVILKSSRRYVDAELIFDYYQNQLTPVTILSKGKLVGKYMISDKEHKVFCGKTIKVWMDNENLENYQKKIIINKDASNGYVGQVQVFFEHQLINSAPLYSFERNNSGLLDIFS